MTISDLVVNVRQITSYPATTPVPPNAAILLQNGGLGSPYISATASALVATALQSGAAPLGVGYTPPADSATAATFTANDVHEMNGAVFFNAYWNGTTVNGLGGGFAGRYALDQGTGSYIWQIGAGQAGQPVTLPTAMQLTQAGALNLSFGTLTVARDPASALEVATMGYVGRSTVASFNGRNGVVQLWPQDIYTALCLDSAIATQSWVTQQITQAFQSWLMTCPVVTRWNGRYGSVYLMLSDITCVFFQPGQQPITPTPPLTSNDNSIANTQWVVEWVTNELAGGGTNFATQAWVLANTVNSFNGRMGAVTLTAADVFGVGAAPLNSPAFSGIPTAPTANLGQATGQIATTAFVQMAIANSVAGVASFNTRTGAVTLESADITAAGGLANPSANLTGNPTAPTQAPGTSTPTIANCEFVMAAIGAAVTSFNTRTGAITLLLSDITSVGGAPLANPTFTGVPAAPTANAGTNTTQIATTAFVSAAVAAAGGVSSFNSRTGAVDLEANDISAAGGLINPNVALTGTPTAPTAAVTTNTNQIATCAFVVAAISANAVASFNGRTGAVTLSTSDITGAGGAPIANPTFTGTPQAPTAAPGTNNTQLATTAFVTAAIAADTAGVTSFNTRTGAVTLVTSDITGAGGAPAASPTFTGNPTAPTATPGTSTTQIATTAFVQAALASSGVASFNGRTGAVTLQANDVSAVGGLVNPSPAMTGTPTTPTAPAGTNTTQVASTAFVQASVASAPMHNYLDNTGLYVNQRGWTSGTAIAAGAYGPDRWKAGAAGCTMTQGGVTPAQIWTITAGSIQQIIEAVALLTATYTLSWTGTAQGRISNTSGGGTYAASPIQFAATANSATYVEFNTGTLSQVQLTLGTIVPVWQPTGLVEEWTRCQRVLEYGWIGLSAYGATASGPSVTSAFNTPKRVPPSLTFVGSVNYFNASGASFVSYGFWGLGLSYTVTSAGSSQAIAQFMASAEL